MSDSKKRKHHDSSSTPSSTTPALGSSSSASSSSSKKAKLSEADDTPLPTNPSQPQLSDWDEGDLEVELCLETMQEDDYWTMKNLLRGYLQENVFNSGEMVDLVLAQREKVGSAITVVGQEEMFGFMSVLDVREHWAKESVQSVLKYVLGRVGSSSQVDEWKRVLTKKESGVGLVVSERIANLPEHIAPHLNLHTFQELSALSPPPNFKYFLLLTNTYKQAAEDVDPNNVELDDDNQESSAPKKKRSSLHKKPSHPNHFPSHQSPLTSHLKSHLNSQPLDPTVHYYKPEDQIFKDCSLLSHSTRVIRNNQQSRWTLQMPTQQSNLFLLIAADQLPRIISQLKKMAADVDIDLKAREATKSK